MCIIGAGIAGLKAASDLEIARIPYIIVEGSNRIGGRIYPVQYGEERAIVLFTTQNGTRFKHFVHVYDRFRL